MTAIAAIEHDGQVWIAGDSAAVDASTGEVITVGTPKVWRRGAFVMGGADSFRYIQVARYVFEPPTLPRVRSDDAHDKYLATEFCPALREAFRSDLELKDGDKYPNIELLIGFRGRVYAIYEDFAFNRPNDGFDAIGSGGQTARIALSCSKGHPRTRLRTALERAEKYTTFVRRPFHYEHA
jgi:ATP-dependent protease HslVU (ClpYQ) peptidase subunit